MITLFQKFLDKQPSVKEQGCEKVKQILLNYKVDDDPDLNPGKVVRGSVQLLVRIIRDKVWSIFSFSTTISNILFDKFVFENSVPKKDLADAVSKAFKEFLMKTADTNERVQVRRPNQAKITIAVKITASFFTIGKSRRDFAQVD